MKIRYAVSTMVFWWRESHISLEQECQYLKSLGFGVELWPTIRGQHDCRYVRKNWSRLKNATDDMLVVMQSRELPTMDQWIEQIECAKFLNASLIADLQDLGLPDNTKINGCNFAADVIKAAEKHEVKLSVETGNLDRLKQLGDKYDYINFCLDVGYANIDPKHDFKQYVDELGDRVMHLHLTDNYGQVDDHEPPGLKGGIKKENWDYLLNRLQNYDHEIIGTLEMFPCMPAVMIRQASEFLFDELKWPDPPKEIEDFPGTNYNPI